MHLLAARAGAVQQEGEAIELGQSPAKIIFASAADSELSAMAAAVDRVGTNEVRLASVLALGHNMSVDLWLEKTVRHAKIVVVRLLGGVSYWPYAVDELSAVAAGAGIKLVLLPGDAVPDPALIERSSVDPDDWRRLHGLFSAGGPDNMDLALQCFKALADGQALAEIKPKPCTRFGFWLPGQGMVEARKLAGLHISRRKPSLPLAGRGGVGAKTYVPILFYRAALDGAGTATLDALVQALKQAGMAPVPLLVSTLKEAACVRFVQAALKRFPPQVILNMTGFALGLDGIDKKQNPFAETDAPVIQLLQGGRSRTLWENDKGLTSRDLAMQVVLPEMDGRHGAILVGHKSSNVWHRATECRLSAYAPDKDGIGRAVELSVNWSRLRQTRRNKRRIAIVLAN